MVKLANAIYGKDKVRVFRIVRNGNVQHLSFPLGFFVCMARLGLSQQCISLNLTLIVTHSATLRSCARRSRVQRLRVASR